MERKKQVSNTLTQAMRLNIKRISFLSTAKNGGNSISFLPYSLKEENPHDEIIKKLEAEKHEQTNKKVD